MSEPQDVELSFEDLTFGGDDFKAKNKELVLAEKPTEEPEIVDNVVLISAPFGSKATLNWPSVLKAVEQLCGQIKVENFREKQAFGFIQFCTREAVEKAIEKVQDYDLEGIKVTAEIVEKLTPGRDPRTHDSNSEFKNSTLVLKNLPFQLKQEKLEELLNVYEWKPQNVSYLYDGSGMFRGMAFVKYKEIDQAQKVFEAMNNLDINGRKLRIEYKRKVQEAETPTDDDNKKLYDQLASFSSNGSLNELAFPVTSSFQRKQLHHIAEKLGLGHYSTGEGENKFVIVKKKEEKDSPASKGQPINNKSRRGSDSKKHSYDARNDEDSRTGTSIGKSGGGGSMPRSFGNRDGNFVKSPPSSYGNTHIKSPPSSYGNSFNSRESFGSTHIKSPPNSYGNSYGKSTLSASLGNSLGTSPSRYGKSPASMMAFRNELPTVSPSRQPKGPDGTNGFTAEYKDQRKKTQAVK